MAKPRSAKGRATETDRRLADAFPGRAKDLCALDFDTPFQLAVATVLSAQTTDERVNMVTPKLFARYPTPADLAAAVPEELEEMIHPTGFFRSKARSLLGLSRELVERFDGEVPTAMEDLVTLPGVGRKTANVIRSVAFGLPGLAVDTHVTRLTGLLGLTESDDPVKIESDVTALLPAAHWGAFGLRVILHGRRTCIARRPRCGECILNDFCPSAFKAGPVAKAAKAAPVAKAAKGAKVAPPRRARSRVSGPPPG
ncbi:MAG TPA: endonuclease III [Acidimicrobiales bacterium]|nr:endonuclease III [Acidimicrobiales bacterium]